MEEFLNLNWSWRTAHSTQRISDVNFSDDEKDVFMCHLNEIDHIHLLDSYGLFDLGPNKLNQNVDPRTRKEVTRHLIDHSTQTRTRLFQDFPQRSSMNSEEHQSGLNALGKLKCDQGNISMLDRKDIRIYSQLYNKRNTEKIQFLEFVKSEFFKRNIKNCYKINPELEKFVTKRWVDAIENVRASEDCCYQLQSALPLDHTDNTNEILIEFEKTLDENGVVMAINRNKYSNPLQMSCSFLENIFTKHVQAPIIQEQLLRNEKIDIVISLTTLSSILNYARDYTIDWNLKFSVNEHNDKKMIVFDEILPPMPFKCLEKNRKAYKYGVTAAIVVPKKRDLFSLKENCFVHQEQQISKEKPPSILSFDPLPTYKILPFDEYLKKIDSNDLITPISDSSNYTYRLWKVTRNNNEYLRFIIGNSHDVCEKLSDGTVQFINLSPKLDYQCEFGAEQMHFSELISEWCELRFGPNTITDRVRIDPITGHIMEVNQITVDDVEHDLNRLFNVKKDLLLDPLFNLVKIIRQFPANKYMLRHQSKNNKQAMVYVKCADKRSPNAITIADVYDSQRLETTNLETIPWNPIDDMTCTAIHRQSNVMPCAFPPWGEKRKVNSNDRQHLVEKAQRKIKEKSDAITKRIAVAKMRKKLRKKKEKIEILAQRKRAKLTFEGESLDPNELFDEQGNIQMISLVTSNKQNSIHTMDDSSVNPICYESYLKDAGANADDSKNSAQNKEILSE